MWNINILPNVTTLQKEILWEVSLPHPCTHPSSLFCPSWSFSAHPWRWPSSLVSDLSLLYFFLHKLGDASTSSQSPFLLTQEVAYYGYSLYFEFFHSAIIPGNHSLSVSRTHPPYFSLWHCSLLCVDVPELIHPSSLCGHLSCFQCLQLQTMLRWINLCTSYCWSCISRVNS